MTKETRKKSEEDGSQSAKSTGEAPLLEQDGSQFRDTMEDDEVCEALKLLYARDKERLKKQDENGSQSAKADRKPLEEEERQIQGALEDDDVCQALRLLHAHEKERLAGDQR